MSTRVVGARRRRLQRLIVASLLMVSARMALGGPPFLTDDPEPVALHHWEAYVFSTYDHPHGSASVQGPAFEVNYGAAPELQLHLVVPWGWEHVSGGPTTSGPGDVEVGVKLRLVDETDSTPQIGVFPMAELPSGDASRGLGNRRAWFRVPLWIQKSWGPWTTYGGGGWDVNHAPGHRDHAFGGWLLQRDFGEQLTLGGELWTEGPDVAGGRGSTYANVGGYYNFTRGFSLLFSSGGTIAGEPHVIAYLGLYWTGGPPSRGP